MFCPQCRGLMKPGPSGPQCPKCGTEGKGVRTGSQVRHKEVTVIEETIDQRPIEKGVHCEECDNDEAFFHMMQTRKSDEPPTLFYECTECHNKWRKY